ncbi:MAG: hypothetical protein DHS20C21_06440 [Gemmatimonadota bacterium]|nr:MAG: hypothetical protein DHS20C21_06440 [Gemmatimonadota bacterium]
MRCVIVMILLMATSSAAQATTHRVPEDYATINAAIDVAASGDSILVGPGTWTSETRSLTVCTNFLTLRDLPPFTGPRIPGHFDGYVALGTFPRA